MADPLSLSIGIASIIASASVFTTQTHQLARKLKKNVFEVEKQLEDVKVLCLVLGECEEIFGSHEGIPLSAKECMNVCIARYKELEDILDEVRARLLERPGLRRLLNKFHVIATEDERQRAYNAFRDSVLLLRDLSTEVRTQRQLTNMSASFAEMMVTYDGNHQEHDEPDNDDEAQAIQEDEKWREFSMTPKMAREAGSRSAKAFSTMRRAQRGRVAALLVADLVEQNFTRNIVLVYDKGDHLRGPEKFGYETYRAKVDSGCDENLITVAALEVIGIDESRLTPVPNHHEIKLDGFEKFSCTPKFSIKLAWYQDGAIRLQRATFYVVSEAPFEILIGSKKFAQELNTLSTATRTGLFLMKRSRNRDELTQERAAHTQHLQEQKNAHDQYLLEEARRRRDARAQATVSPGRTTPDTGPASDQSAPTNT